MTVLNILSMDPLHVPQAIAIEEASQTPPWSEAFMRAELQDPHRRYVVAVDRAAEDTDVLGFGGILIAADEAHITNVAVDPCRRGEGIGRALVLALIGQAVRAGAAAATLEVRAGNQPARRLYSSLGFVPAGIRPGYYPSAPERAGQSEDAVIMWLHNLPALTPQEVPSC